MNKEIDRAGDVGRLAGLKERDLVALGTSCAVCGRPLLGEGPTFYRVTVEQVCLVPAALQRRAGFEMVIGALAAVMGPDEDLAKVTAGPATVGVHEQCAIGVPHLFMFIEAKGDKS